MKDDGHRRQPLPGNPFKGGNAPVFLIIGLDEAHSPFGLQASQMLDIDSGPNSSFPYRPHRRSYSGRCRRGRQSAGSARHHHKYIRYSPWFPSFLVTICYVSKGPVNWHRPTGPSRPAGPGRLPDRPWTGRSVQNIDACRPDGAAGHEGCPPFPGSGCGTPGQLQPLRQRGTAAKHWDRLPGNSHRAGIALIHSDFSSSRATPQPAGPAKSASP